MRPSGESFMVCLSWFVMGLLWMVVWLEVTGMDNGVPAKPGPCQCQKCEDRASLAAKAQSGKCICSLGCNCEEASTCVNTGRWNRGVTCDCESAKKRELLKASKCCEVAK